MMYRSILVVALLVSLSSFLFAEEPPLLDAPATKNETTVVVQAGMPGKPISSDLFGIFFEDINYAADGGLYAELVQNRSFEYQATEQPKWNSLTAWEFTTRGDGKGYWAVDASLPIHPNNANYIVLHVSKPGLGVGVVNDGFDGIPVKQGEKYPLSLFARNIYTGQRWHAPEPDADKKTQRLTAQLETKDGDVLGSVTLAVEGKEWVRYGGTITASETCRAARLVVLAHEAGGLAIDNVSLFPLKTFRGHANGLRADLAQAIADMKPRFIRFPGGCLVHGNGLRNMYRWKDTVGPVEHRKEQANLWGYHQTVGLGYFEYFQFCEDIGAKPVPVVPAAVSCQNSGHTSGTGQQCLPLSAMSDYIQEVLDLIEWANGPVSSPWGAKRAAAGHPEPFNLEYLGIGNEDHITPGFEERFRILYNAVKAKHPEITIIGTVGPSPDGEDFEKGWEIANKLQVAVVDEHYYKNPKWFLENLHRYDGYDRSKSAVYLGEYAAHESDRRTTLRSALAEAAYMTHLERNGDIVRLVSYAPLLGKKGHMQWTPDLIYFDNTDIFPTINYHVQQMFSANQGDVYFPTTVSSAKKTPADKIVASTVLDSASGDLVIKLVNTTSRSSEASIQIEGRSQFPKHGTLTVLAGDDPLAVNPGDPKARHSTKTNPVSPSSSEVTVGDVFSYRIPAYSLSTFRIPLP